LLSFSDCISVVIRLPQRFRSYLLPGFYLIIIPRT
jgi:hypothetical protein